MRELGFMFLLLAVLFILGAIGQACMFVGIC